jgi:hypothetical protein
LAQQSLPSKGFTPIYNILGALLFLRRPNRFFISEGPLLYFSSAFVFLCSLCKPR